MDEGARAAAELAQAQEQGSRVHGRWMAWLVAGIAGGWSLFQMALPAPWLPPVPDSLSRILHLAFAITLVYLCFPQVRGDSRLGRWLQGWRWLRPLARERGFPWLDCLLATMAALCVLYHVWDAPGIASRQGRPSGLDQLAGWGLVALLLIAASRCLGPALSVLALIFMGLVFFGGTLFTQVIDTDWWTLRNASPTAFISQMSMSTEGIFGTPLMVSTNVVFLFVLLGTLLNHAGGGRWFTDLALAAVGRYRGGPAKAAVLASGLTGSVSGSSIANTVTTGTFTIPLMQRAGYPAVKAGAIEVAASTNGQLMPPIMGAAAFIIATLCGIPYLDVVKHALIPAVVSYLALIWITHVEAAKLGLRPIPRELLPRFIATFISGWYYLIPIILLLVQLVWLRRSPERAAFDAILALVALLALRAAWFAHRQGASPIASAWAAARAVGSGLSAGGLAMMTIGVAVAAAGIIVGIVNMGMGGMITEFVATVSGDNFLLLLLLTAIAGLVLGIGLPTTANYIVMASLTAPIIMSLAPPDLALPLIAVHLFVFYFGILADDTPPVGLAAYAAAAISKASPIATGVQGFTYDLRTALLPFMFIFNHQLLLIGVDTLAHGLAVFVTALVAMLCFASLTQSWVLTRNRWSESILLILAILCLLRPDLISGWWGSTQTWPKLLGLACAGLVLGAQWLRCRAMTGSAQPPSAAKAPGAG
ncbi:MAG: TRAP transporter permease [Planctomycetota bacterium]|nr:MAG: TRAP transporter permease [Planctomycetota bacterium]